VYGYPYLETKVTSRGMAYLVHSASCVCVCDTRWKCQFSSIYISMACTNTAKCTHAEVWQQVGAHSALCVTPAPLRSSVLSHYHAGVHSTP